MLFWIAPALRLAPFVLGGLDYLRSLLFPSAVPTSSASSYVPHFRGGQSIGVMYDVLLDYATSDGRSGTGNIRNAVTGRVNSSSFTIDRPFGSFYQVRIFVNGQPVGFVQQLASTDSSQSMSFSNLRFVRSDGMTDTGGDFIDPSGGIPISGDGIATSAPPNLDSAPVVIEAIPPIALPSFAAALAAALAAARNALDALDAIKAVARAIEALSDLLNKKNDEENKKEKEKKENQDTIRYQFGSIEKDGFLRLYPDSNLVKYVAQQLDISFITIPSYLGKYFGKFSPNYYRYKPTSNLISSLGYISFVSPTFGIMSTHHLEFRRTSIKVPENSIGFYYHLGLDGALTANAFAFYTKPKP